MATITLKVNLSPLETQWLLEQNIAEAMTFSDAYELGEGKYIFVTVYEKFYSRSFGAAGLLVICENTTGTTLIKLSNTGGGVSPLLSDLGSGRDFIQSVEQIFTPYVILS